MSPQASKQLTASLPHTQTYIHKHTHTNTYTHTHTQMPKVTWKNMHHPLSVSKIGSHYSQRSSLLRLSAFRRPRSANTQKSPPIRLTLSHFLIQSTMCSSE